MKTNGDCIREMDNFDLAFFNVKTISANNGYGDSEYLTSDGKIFERYDDAIDHERLWLQSEAMNSLFC